MPMTLEELIDSVRRLADSNFATAAALNKLLSPFEQLRRDIYDIKTSREIDTVADRTFIQNLSDKDRSLIQELNTSLAVVLENVKIAQSDVKALSKEVTGAFPLPPVDNRSAAERMIDRFERMSTATKLWVFAFVLVVVAAFGAHLIIGAFTGG